MALFTIENLSFTYPGQTAPAIDRLTLTVPEGAFLVLCGPSGCGKSTLMRTISGLVKAQSGSILWNGQEVLGRPIDQIVASGIAMSPEGRRVFADLTVVENLKIGAYLRRDKAEMEQDLEWVYSLFPRLKERSWQSAGTLSGGEQQMLAVGRAHAGMPPATRPVPTFACPPRKSAIAGQQTDSQRVAIRVVLDCETCRFGL